MNPYHRGSFLLGIVVIALGVVLLLNNFNIINISVGYLVLTYWPLLLVLWGIDLLLPDAESGGSKPGRKSGALITGLILIALGLLITGHNLDLYELNFSFFWRIFWPVVIILIGWSLLRSTSGSGGAHWAVMSGIELKQQGWKLEDGSYFALMGGVDMDLNAAEIPEGEISINATAVMGGIEIIVPPGITVEYEGTAVLGGVKFFNEDSGGVIAGRKSEYKGNPESRTKLILKCTAIMGGIEIKH
ncbi:MAG: cell wall-active antibiotics response protein [Desulfotomaculaceae bacterium]|nr:cell wall-active antibiotics response protein [Desulfotomaculaceae bacterium]